MTDASSTMVRDLNCYLRNRLSFRGRERVGNSFQ